MSSRIDSRDAWKGTIGSPDETQDVLLSMTEVIGRKWHPIILYHLYVEGSVRFSDLKGEIGEISSKMLSESLGQLEETYDLVDRTIVDEKPLCVEYSLTGRGESVGPIIGELRRWGLEHLQDDHLEAVSA